MLRVLFGLEAVADFLFGIPLILATANLLSLYAMSTDRVGSFYAQFLGATFVGFGLLNWVAQTWTDSRPRQLLIRVDFVTTAIGFVIALTYQLQPGTPIQSWAIVGLTSLFGIGWAYFALGTLRERRAA